jgi:RNA polymerase sigma-70 factor (ECF subfamily)
MPHTARREAFEQVVAEVYEPLQRYLRRRLGPDDAQDVLSDALLTIWRRIDDVPSPNPLPWCYGVARLTLSNFRRGRDRHLRLVRRLEQEPRAEPDTGPGSEDGDPQLEEALASLPEGDREILRLWAWERLEPGEIAMVLQVSPNAATLRLSRARRKLADALEGRQVSA